MVRKLLFWNRPRLLKMIKIISPFLIRVLTGNFARAMAVYPFVIFKEKELITDPIILNHERIHLRQQLELLLLLFYILYLMEYLMGRFKGLNHDTAYHRIRFEQEAYEHEADLSYLKTRKWWAVWRNNP